MITRLEQGHFAGAEQRGRISDSQVESPHARTGAKAPRTNRGGSGGPGSRVRLA